MSKSLAYYAFNCLISKLESSPCTNLVDLEKSTTSKTGNYPEKAPLFVTWNKNGVLRGCIGTFLPLSVDTGVSQYALISAFEDTRFRPIKVSELPSLSVGITLLDNFTEIADPNDWEIGIHGLKVLFSTDKVRRFLGTFLPLVSEEQGWTRAETLHNLLKKAGLNTISLKETPEYYSSAMAAKQMKLVRYEGLKCRATYQEYLEATHGT